MTDYVRIERGGSSLVVTAKAARTLYTGKGYKITGPATAPAERKPAPEPQAKAEDSEDVEAEIEIKRILRGSAENVIAWINAGEGPGEIVHRAERVFEAEAQGRNRTGLMDAAAEIARGGAESGGGEAEGSEDE